MEPTAIDTSQARLLVSDLGERPREIFRHLVDAFLASGEPVGSRTLSQRLPHSLSPASIRYVPFDSRTVQVAEPTNATPVRRFTPGPAKWIPARLERSLTVIR